MCGLIDVGWTRGWTWSGKRAAAVLLSVAIAGCASRPAPAPVGDVGRQAAAPSAGQAANTSPSDTPEGVRITPLGEDTTSSRPLPGQPAPRAVATPTAPALSEPPPPRNPAVLALLDDADISAQSGDHQRAGASLERALKIDPEDPWLWHRLARARLAEGRAVEVEPLALRSNALAPGNSELLGSNWNLIAMARDSLGDSSGAADARALALGARG